jgi:hypothetical protein
VWIESALTVALAAAAFSVVKRFLRYVPEEEKARSEKYLSGYYNDERRRVRRP